MGDRIRLTGLAANHQGLVWWNTAAGAPEPPMSGHATNWTPCSIDAPYYVASRDHAEIDPRSDEGFRSIAPIEGLPGLQDALSANGFTTAAITVSWTVQTLGKDLEGSDWTFDAATGTETRFYQGGELAMRLNGEPLLGGAIPQTRMTIKYNDPGDCSDDEISAVIARVIPVDLSARSSAPVQAVASALLDDLAGHGLTLVFDSMRPVGGPLAASGRTGAFLESSAGRVEVDALCSCSIGIHDEDETHEWTMFWPETTLPENEPVRLKVVAATASSAAPPAGKLSVTVFDESAPMRGVVLDIAYPVTRGEAEGWIELDILPQQEYRFTLQHTGSGREYRLGSSPPVLRLSQSDQRYLPGRSQDWAIDVAGRETVTLELATDADAPVPQATTAFVTVRDARSHDIVHGPALLAPSPASARTVSFQHEAAARRLLVQIDADGAFRLKRTDGDGRVSTLPCPSRSGFALPTLTMTDAGVTPRELFIDNGERIFVINRSASTHQLASDPHPFHTDCPALNQPGPLRPGESGTSDPLNVAGTCGFHDHLNPFQGAFTGLVVVQGAGGGDPEPDDTEPYE